ncbi:MAG: hypothetical protein J6T82_05560 [Bacteroidaceae bacterium]|nr:hypothetical protein [Bacteroidaceae bacterium]
MTGFELTLIIVVSGALIGFFFSKKGHEKEGAIEGAKTSCGCILAFILLLIGAIILFAIMASGAI